MFQLFLESCPVRFSFPGGLPGQLRDAAKVLLHLGQYGFSPLERPAALPGVVLRLTGPAHQLPQRFRDGKSRGFRHGPALTAGALLFRFGRGLVLDRSKSSVSANGQFTHFQCLLSLNHQCDLYLPIGKQTKKIRNLHPLRTAEQTKAREEIQNFLPSSRCITPAPGRGAYFSSSALTCCTILSAHSPNCSSRAGAGPEWPKTSLTPIRFAGTG